MDFDNFSKPDAISNSSPPTVPLHNRLEKFGLANQSFDLSHKVKSLRFVMNELATQSILDERVGSDCLFFGMDVMIVERDFFLLFKLS